MQYIITNDMSINDTIKILKAGDTLLLKPGIYKEKIEILANDITIIGEEPSSTVITNHDFYHKIMSDNNECNTFRTYTMFINGNNVRLKNLTIENSAIPSNKYGQAVALHVQGNNFQCENCIIKSAQDTLFTGPLPTNLIQRYKNFLPDYFLVDKSSKQIYKYCTIIGDVDFIFGGATALFYECKIVSLARMDKILNEPNGYICAPSHKKELQYGFLFYKCDIICENGCSNVYLARPWRDYGCAAFILCNMAEHINPIGYNKWGNTNRDKTARFYEYSLNIDMTKRAPWIKVLNDQEAKDYLKSFNDFLGNFDL